MSQVAARFDQYRNGYENIHLEREDGILLMTLHTISLVHKWYEVAKGFEKSRVELAKAQKSFDYFQNQFENVGKSLDKAQEAFDKATTHLKAYRGKVSALSGQEQLELDTSPVVEEKPLPLLDKASA